MRIQTTEQFAEAVRQYAQKVGLTRSKLADQIGKPRQTVDDWFKKGVKRKSARDRIIAEHPEIFDGFQSLDKTPADSTSAATAEIPHEHTHTFTDQEVFALVKTERAHHDISSLTETLQWFLFQATPNDRNKFRDSLGETWKYFLELTRAMTGEKAYEIAKQEGRIK